jgi:dolichol-phosphate mannosyltransferase
LPSHLVIIPTYNEKENVLKIINAVFGLAMPFHVLIIDDGSPDGTADLVKMHQKSYADRLFIEERKGKLGLGTAYIHGFNWGLARNYDFIYEMDADFSHNPNDLIRLFEKCQNEGFDMSVGSRYVKGGKLENWPLGRILLSYGASVYVRLITFMNIKDPTAGFVCYSNRVLGNIDLEKIRFIGYAFQIEMKYAAKTLGFSIGEVPITFKDRVEGISKMNSSIIKEAIIGVVQLRWNSFFNSYKKVASELSKT